MNDKQTCAICGVSWTVPEESQENMCTVKVKHHYGSRKDGNVEVFDVCLKCIEKHFKGKPIKVIEEGL